MKGILKKIGNFFKSIAKKMTVRDWIILVLIILLVISALSVRHYYKKTLFPTVIHDSDSLKTYNNKKGEIYVANDMYVQKLDQIKKENRELYDEIKKLKDNPITVTKTQFEFKTDTIPAKSDSIKTLSPIEKSLYWSAKESHGYYSIAGQTNIKTDLTSFSTTVNSLSIPAELTMDIIEKDKKLLVIGKTNNPYVRITGNNSVMIDPTKSTVIKSYFKPKRWNFGIQAGYGIGADFKLRSYIGVGISYGLIQWK